jgi:uroporphyrinogen-III synthase
MHLLVTRPGADAERTAQALRARGHKVTVAPALQFEAIADVAFAGPFTAIAMTSANAARALMSHPQRAELTPLRVFTVGWHTAAAAQAAGFARIESADGGLPDLVRLIAASLRGGRVLYLAADDRSGDLAGALAAYGIAVDTVVIYRMVTNPRLAQELSAAIDDRLDGVLHYSSAPAPPACSTPRSASPITACRARSPPHSAPPAPLPSRSRPSRTWRR